MRKSKGISRNRLEALQLAKDGLTRKKNMYGRQHVDSRSSAKKMSSPKVRRKGSRKSRAR